MILLIKLDRVCAKLTEIKGTVENVSLHVFKIKSLRLFYSDISMGCYRFYS